MPEKKYTFCRICEAACGLIVKVENNRIINISPNPKHLASRGFACKKGLKFDEILHSPDRITAPMKRREDSWEEISWKQGDRAEISTETGSIVLPVKITEEMSPGAVAAPWGWGHSNAKGLSTARKTEGANINVLTLSGPEAVDPVSGMAHLTAIPVEVRRKI